MAKLTFLWHLHQPQYRTADGRVHAPWVLLHSAGEYLTLVHALLTTGLRGQVLNLTPVFLEQLQAYRDGAAHDPLLQALGTPARDLPPEARLELLRWAFLLHPNQLRRWPRLAELAARATGAAPTELLRRFSTQDLIDVQVLLVLAYSGPNLAWEPEIADVAAQGPSFSDEARGVASRWLAGCPGRLLEGYRRLAGREGVEISTSPYAHPIMPLLIDTRIAAESWAPNPAPPVPVFAAPEDAARQLASGLDLMRAQGFQPVGCWPPEGSVSEAALAVYLAQGIRWLAADEGILAASLGRNVTGEHGVSAELCRSWMLAAGGPTIFFRHRDLSDFISFQAGRMADEALAAREFAERLRRLAARLPDEAGIVLALDGENPWTGYPDGGSRFLLALGDELQGSGRLRPMTLAQRTAEERPAQLPRLHPGSWIGATFATWIGHPEKNRGWELLGQVRALGGLRGGASWLAAQGSDWWWWLGEDNPTLLAPLYDELFRAHLRDACTAAGVHPPSELSAPVRSASIGLRVPLAASWPAPALDGQATSYFEWSVATWVEAPATHRRFARAALRAQPGRLWLRVDPRPGSSLPTPLVVTIMAGEHRTTLTLPRDLPRHCAIGRALVADLPLPAAGDLLALESAGERMPVEGFWRLEFVDVDEP